MENLILNTMYNYFIVGILFAVLADISIRAARVNKPSTFIEILAIILAWPVVVATVVINFIHKNTQ